MSARATCGTAVVDGCVHKQEVARPVLRMHSRAKSIVDILAMVPQTSRLVAEAMKIFVQLIHGAVNYVRLLMVSQNWIYLRYQMPSQRFT